MASTVLAAMLALGLVAGAVPCARAEGESTLDKIALTSTISLGHRESSVPFSYYDDKHQVVGYSHDLMLRIVEAIRAELKLPAITIRLVPVTPQNRIPLVVNGTVDLECGSTTHTLERARKVGFSNSIFVVGTRLLTARDSGIQDFPDLAGKRVVVTAGTTSERLVRRYDEERQMDIRIVVAKDHGGSFRELEAGRADAFMMDDALLHGERAKARQPGHWVVVGTPMSYEAYACMMRKDDPALKKVVDAALARIMASGEAGRLYARWFKQPIPPKGLNLAWPESAAVLQLFRAPNDRPVAAGSTGAWLAEPSSR
jgi:glutamate/aspartate transport system substrate-binding protein